MSTVEGSTQASAVRIWGGRLATAAAALVLLAALLLPDQIARLSLAAFLRLPIEAAAVLFLFAVLPGRWPARLVGALVGLSVIVKLFDMGGWQALGRPFNPVLDVALLDALRNLLVGAVGLPAAAGLAAGAVVLALVVLAVSIAAAARTAALARRHRRAAGGIAAVLALAWGGLFATGVETAKWLPAASADTSRLLARHVAGIQAALADRAAFAGDLAHDPAAAFPADRLFAGLRGRDVLLLFVESYGVTTHDDPRYAPAVTALLAEGERRLAARGLHAASARLTSTTVGGQSWLAHGTLLSGLRIDNQRRYDSLVTSSRLSLNALFHRAGWRTVAAMPAITMAWPEATWFGYDRVMAAGDLGYRGRPFNWVTMPDQYTLAALRREELDRPGRGPVMAEVALISSHAPWTPIPSLVDWSTVGDGRVFDGMAAGGETPEVVWADPEKIRLQFRLSIEYALSTILSYADTYGLDDTVLLVLGDHQPAPIITGEDAPRDVPVHVLTADPAIADAFRAAGFVTGLRPPADRPVLPMEDVRGLLVERFSSGPLVSAGPLPDGVAAAPAPTIR